MMQASSIVVGLPRPLSRRLSQGHAGWGPFSRRSGANHPLRPNLLLIFEHSYLLTPLRSRLRMLAFGIPPAADPIFVMTDDYIFPRLTQISSLLT